MFMLMTRGFKRLTSSKIVQIDTSKYEEIANAIKNSYFERTGIKSKPTTVFTNGCFDLLHDGHIHLLSKCRQLAGRNGVVVVGVNSDESVGRLKGPTRPIRTQVERARMLISMRYVDYVVVFEEDTPLDLINALDPDVIVKGGDYKNQEVVGADGRILHLVEFSEGQSTTSLIERIKKS